MRISIISPEKKYLLWLLLAALLLVSCAREPDTSPRVWIDYPRQNLRVPPDQPLVVHSHAYAAGGVAEVVLSVDGVAYTRTQPGAPGAEFSDFQQEWLPPEEGTYLLQVVAYNSEGMRSNPATLTITVGELGLAEVPPQPPEEDIETVPESEPETDPEPICPPLATVNTNANCRSGPGDVYPVLASLTAGTESPVSGRSQDGYWWVINPPGVGGACWIWEELVDLSTDTCQVAVVEAPPPPRDQTPPPVPQPTVPADGLSLGCRAAQNLAWLPVQDESGIAGYSLRLDKEVSAGNWQRVNQWNEIQGKQYQVPVDCGLRYRWSVQAEDGEGNLSPWSGYSRFSVDLD